VPFPADPSQGDGDRVVLAGWPDTWTAESIRAAEALAPLFGAGASETIGTCLSRVLGPAGKARRVGIRALSHEELAPDRRPRRPHGYLRL